MEAILTVAVMAVIVVGIFMTVKSDASPLHKAMLMLIIFVVGVPGGSIAVALAQISPVWGFVAVALVVAFASAILPRGSMKGRRAKIPLPQRDLKGQTGALRSQRKPRRRCSKSRAASRGETR